MQKNRATILARVASVVLHPVVVPVYVLVVLLWGGHAVSYLVPGARLYFFSIVALNTVIVPLSFMGILAAFGRKERKTVFRERIVPMLVLAGCYVACLFIVKGVALAFSIKKLLEAGIGCMGLGIVVTLFWRISLNMIAQGAVVTFLTLMIASGAVQLTWALCVAIALAASLASARLYLGKHTPGQVAAGFAGGVVMTLYVILLT
jgi:membrane-associated phospholipid phosphatase